MTPSEGKIMTRGIGWSARTAAQMTARLKGCLADPEGRAAAALLVVASLLAVAIRLPLFGFESLDYKAFLHPWSAFIRANHGFWALRALATDYPPLYVTCLALLTYLPLPDLFAIKLLSLAFELFAAVLAYRLVKIKYPAPFLPALAYVAVLCWPTVILNGSMWGQCDAIYTSWLLAMLLALLSKKHTSALVFFGLALSFKLQAIFLFPLLLLAWPRKEISFWPFLLIPMVYLLSGFPMVIAGKPTNEVHTIYLLQAGRYQELVQNAPNLYQWLPPTAYDHVVIAGSMLALLFVVWLSFFTRHFLRNLVADAIVQLALILAIAIPFLLPKMHERYFFLADVVAVLYGFFFPRRFYVPLVVCLLSFLSYGPYLFGEGRIEAVIDLRYAAVGMAGVLVLLLHDLIRRCRAEQPPIFSPPHSEAHG